MVSAEPVADFPPLREKLPGGIEGVAEGGDGSAHVIRFATRNAIHMSSRNDHRRRDRSWERSDRDRDRDRYRDRDRGGDRGRGRGDRYRDSRRKSRSRSPRRGDHDRRLGVHDLFSFSVESSLGIERDRRDHRYDDRRDSDRRDRDDRRRDDRRDDRDRHRDDPRDRDVSKHFEAKPSPGLKEESGKHWRIPVCQLLLTRYQVPPVPEPRIQSEGLENGQEEGESMDVVNQDDEAMMAAMGIAGFGSTKVCVFSRRAYQYLENSHRESTLKGTKKGPQR